MHFWLSSSRRRKVVAIVLVVDAVLVLVSFFIFYDVGARLPALRLPAFGRDNSLEITEMTGGRPWTPLPTYGEIFQQEKRLPQHNVSLPYPEGRNGTYVKFSNQIRMLGWNNVLNEVLLCSHLAWRAKRAYVFQDYFWKLEHYPWRVSQGVPQTPISALIAGPTAGGSWDEGDDTPRSVSESYFNTVCPLEDTEIIDSDVAKEPIRNMDGEYTVEHWLKLLNESPKRCVLVVSSLSGDDWFPQTFDLWLISTNRILNIWPQFRDSPVSKLLQTSSLVNSAIERNEHLFFPPSSDPYTNRYGGMMAIHLRRGDYLQACQGLSDWSSGFYQWNLLPDLPDRFDPPPGGGAGNNTAENEALYFKRCFPTETQVLEKIEEFKLVWEMGAAALGRTLSSLYIMTNADKDWLDGFRDQLFGEGWSTVVSASDLVLDAEQMAVSMAVDMDVGRRAALFIGNGWSSLTSNVVHRRLVDGNEPSSIRFW